MQTPLQPPFYLWGVLNCTPDSFSDGCLDATDEQRVAVALKMVTDGASIIDIGGESTRPGSSPVDLEEEWRRVGGVIRGLRESSEVLISIDTSKAEIARRALATGANIVNDISAGGDPAMAGVVAEFKAQVVLMHMQGKPENMQDRPRYIHAVEEIVAYLQQRVEYFVAQGVDQHSIYIDPGIGFGKSLAHNLQLMTHLDELEKMAPVLLGVSRKSYIGLIDASAGDPKDRLGGSLAPIFLALSSGVRNFRVHDVKPTRQFCLVTLNLLERSR